MLNLGRKGGLGIESTVTGFQKKLVFNFCDVDLSDALMKKLIHQAMDKEQLPKEKSFTKQLYIGSSLANPGLILSIVSTSN